MKPNGPLSLIFFVGSLIFTAGMTWAAVKEYSPRIEKLEKKTENTERALWYINSNIELLMRASGVKPLPKE